jgi:hypothetical protein
MKKIVAIWEKAEKEFGGKELRVIQSNHPRFVVDSRFDFGFLNIATEEGYICEIHPMIKSSRGKHGKNR